MFEIEFLGFDKADTSETIGMGLDEVFEGLVKSIIPADWLAKSKIISDAAPAIVAWALIRYAKVTGVPADMLMGIMKKNLSEVVVKPAFGKVELFK